MPVGGDLRQAFKQPSRIGMLRLVQPRRLDLLDHPTGIHDQHMLQAKGEKLGRSEHLVHWMGFVCHTFFPWGLFSSRRLRAAPGARAG